MITALDIAKQYFEVSNRSDMETIAEMLTDSTTYSSPHTGIYLGKQNIITMQTSFHTSFTKLHWEVTQYNEESPGIVLCYFDFEGTKKTGETVSFSAKEYVIVFEGKIQHIEIRL